MRFFKAQSGRIQERKKEEESANAVILEEIDYALSVQRENDLSQFTREAMSGPFQGIWRKFLPSKNPVSYTHVCVIL